MLSFGGDGVSFWWYVIGVAVVLMAIKGRGGGSAFIHVPDGENWRTVYRRRVIERRRGGPNMSSKLVMGLGLGIAVAAVMWALQQ